ncbi:response regulator transcription factor [Fulvivirga sp. M361]|uniref:response regulator transcription factor n=1 Tax=Fulvivirga sp. M361 TaxID=2594266 RepID=UPI00117A11CE|nr:response regulator transcription factor [Fulvivirga sp. M361]TRX45852.1 response regulator transcription factor [Fulvivirga sp. M361]
MIKKILLIEDELNVASFIKKGLDEEGYEVTISHDGESGLAILSENQFDLLILDVILPKMTGLDVCGKIRDSENKQLPILMLTALGTTESVVNGLDSGADDYLTKPFKFSELLAIIRTISRRKGLFEDSEQILSIADMKLNLDAKTVRRANSEITLTPTEYRLLEYFMKNQKKVLSRVDLPENVWNINFDMGTNVVDVYVNYLRNKVDKAFDQKLIHTVIGMGYVMREEN